MSSAAASSPGPGRSVDAGAAATLGNHRPRRPPRLWPPRSRPRRALALSLGAIGWGLRDRLEDLRAGGDREAAAKRRRGLLDAARRRRAERPAKRAAALRGALPLGRTRREQLASVGRGTPTSGSHVLIPGATGAGKTTSLASLLVEYVTRSGFGAVVLEAKTDRVLLASAEAAADRPRRALPPALAHRPRHL